MEANPMKENVPDGDFVEGFISEDMFVFEILNEVESVKADLPITKAAISPLAEVCGRNGLSLEVGGEDGLDLRQGVEPLEKTGAIFAVEEALIEFFTDGVREAGDFSFAHNGGGVME